MIVVEAPHTMRAGGFKIVRRLQLPQKLHVPGDDQQREGGKSGRREEREAVQTEQPGDEVQLVSGSVVYTLSVAEGVA